MRTVVAGGGYRVATSNGDSPAERVRLEEIQRNVDAHTILVLEDLPLASSWNCLELGAGAGSIAYWLADRCLD
jgi:hypothetical protein